jgi:hypothetical protein
MKPEHILKAMRAQRELGVDMGNERRMTVLRPTELEIQRDLVKLLPGPAGTPVPTLQIDTDTVHRYVVGWAGYTEADLLGPAGGSDAAPFAPELVQEWLSNHPEDIGKLLDALFTCITTHINARAEAAKN